MSEPPPRGDGSDRGESSRGEGSQKSRSDAVLDLLVFAPLGLVATAAQELPHLAEIGHRRMTTRLANAHFVGKMTLHVGSRRAKKKVQQAGEAMERFLDDRQRAARRPGGQADMVSHASAPQESPVARPVAGRLGRQSSDSDTLALGIPGFDALSASQVVQRLAGLTREELLGVQSYEEAHRGRRTVLARVAQLRATS